MLWMVRVSRNAPARDGRKRKRTRREPYGRTEPLRSSRRICTSKEACLPVLATLYSSGTADRLINKIDFSAGVSYASHSPKLIERCAISIREIHTAPVTGSVRTVWGTSAPTTDSPSTLRAESRVPAPRGLSPSSMLCFTLASLSSLA